MSLSNSFRTRMIYSISTLVFAGLIAATAEPRSDLQGLTWMTGYWVAREGNNQSEELWMRPSGGVMLGLHRDVRNSTQASFEYLRIELGASGPEYVASPGGRVSTRFALREIGSSRAVFENLEHDFPKRILYWLDSSGNLRARVEGEIPGSEPSLEWTWQKAPFGVQKP